MKQILFIGLIVLGAGFVVLGSVMLYSMVQFKRSAIRTTATVVEIKTSTGRSTSTITYSPVLSFIALDGKNYIYDVSRFSYTHYTIGQEIEIVYENANPNKANINSFYNIFLTPLVLIVLGIFTVIIALYCIYSLKR